MADKIIGDPVPFPNPSPAEIQQEQMDTCAVKSQQIIMHAFGLDIPESQLAEEAAAKGYYQPGSGSTPELVGQLLNDHGIPTHIESGATVYDLVNELAQGHKVIVGVDAEELWRPDPLNDIFGEEANHALIVTGIDTSDPNHVEVVLTDPGTGDVAKRYPLEQFMDAWHDSNCLYVATDMPAPAEFSPEMINFDYDTGHLPSILSVPYNFFVEDLLPIIHDAYEWCYDAITDNFVVHAGEDFVDWVGNVFNDVYDYISGIINSFIDGFHEGLGLMDLQSAISTATSHIEMAIDDFMDGFHDGQDLGADDFHSLLFA